LRARRLERGVEHPEPGTRWATLPDPIVRTLLMTSMELDMTTYNSMVTATLHVCAARRVRGVGRG